MIGDLIEGLLQGYFERRGARTGGWQAFGRVFFGGLGLVLSTLGMFHFLARGAPPGGGPTRVSIALMFGALSLVFLFNVTLARASRWTIVLFVISFVGIFVTRIALGP